MSAAARRARRLHLEALEDRRVPATAVGMNLDRLIDFSPAWVFTDAFQQSRPWVSYAYNPATGAQTIDGTPVTDARGWPIRLDAWTNAQGQAVRQRLGT